MAQYRLTSEGHFNDAFKLISVRVTQNIGGEDVEVDVKKNPPQELFSAIVPPGAVVEVPDSLIPGQHMQPVDAAAKKMCDAYPDASRPALWNTLEGLPNTVDMRSNEEMIASAMQTAIAAAFKAGRQADQELPKLALKSK
jgi:hypothetical protein